MESTVIILCGGLGTRLRKVVSDRPKAMALINGRPFLDYQIAWLKSKGVLEIILAVGFKSDQIADYFGNGENCGINIKYSYEENPLGTGGAILSAMETHKLGHCVVVNGDSFLDIDLKELEKLFFSQNANLCITCHYIDKADRYGVVEFDQRNRLLGLSEKKILDSPAWINSGIYMLNHSIFDGFDSNSQFSFETDVLSKSSQQNCYVFKCWNKSFIDIGTPESFQAADDFFKFLD